MTNAFQVVKFDEARNEIFGIGSISLNVDGHLVNDLQDEQIEPGDLEDAVYKFNLDFRETGEMHKGEAKGRLIESMLITPEKIDKLLGDRLPAELVAAVQKALGVRWWLGFKVEPDTFAKVKSGQYSMFSIQGSAEKVPVPA